MRLYASEHEAEFLKEALRAYEDDPYKSQLLIDRIDRCLINQKTQQHKHRTKPT